MRSWLLAAALLGGCTADPPPTAKSPLHILTALPLFWGEGDISGVLNGKAGAHPALAGLGQHWQVTPLDIARPQHLSVVRHLLIAQPSALAPDELVAIDAWVRAGGHAVLLVDPDLRWPSHYAAGDPRRAPVQTLLTPLFTHWGVRLVPDPPGAPPRQARIQDQIIALPGSGRWVVQQPGCVVQDPAVVQCALGKGAVVLIADADFIATPPEFDGDDRGSAAIQHLFQQISLQNQSNERVSRDKEQPPRIAESP